MPEVFNYISQLAEVKIKLPLRFRIKAWFLRRRPEVRTLYSESRSFRCIVKFWWKPSDRKMARVALAAMDFQAEEFKREVQKKAEWAILFGADYEKKTWEK